ncbi:hypothetical protein [Alicyclobacillus sp. ALC3]|uniref:hypothetical protein n=1 Tax=Alicyclobacillus sp. ALC3 TaxID=2796143 RepID=UPI002378939B|nr:hypothetical protein [Alicyclobacillus sp. ALC3]WDL97042.1 hypothetical protein JC200_22690 [Alicyclobacillus sp. ALC3]
MKKRNSNSLWVLMILGAGLSVLTSRLLNVPWLFATLTADAGGLVVWFATRHFFSRRKRCTR